MSWPIPHCTPAAWPAELNPGRFAAHIHRGVPVACRVALLGLPDDLGVRLNNGRPGAGAGPGAFRAALTRYGAASPCGWEYPKIFDAGDIVAAPGHDEAALHETHQRISEAVREIARLGMLPVAVGGGHDLTFPFVRGVIDHYRLENPIRRFDGVYFDAHLDVRESVGSGMPFRRLIEACGVARLDLFGFSPYANSQEHLAWFLSQGGRLCDDDQIFAHPPLPEHADTRRFVSLDLDVIDASAAPGVSATNPCGMSPERVARLAHAAGKDPRVVCFDIMELCPRNDHMERTARLAAHMFLVFLRGLSERLSGAGADA